MKNQINKRHRNLCLFDLFPFKIKLNTFFCFVKRYLKFFAFYFYTCVLMEKKILRKVSVLFANTNKNKNVLIYDTDI